MRHTHTIPHQKKEIDQESYNRLQGSLANLKEQLSKIRSQISAIRDNDGSNLSESPSFLFLIAQESGKVKEIKTLQDEINSLVVVEMKKNDEEIVLGNLVTVEIAYPNNIVENKKYLLVGSTPNLLKGEISQTSPIGKFIKGKKVGDQGEVLLPNQKIIKIKIISKE